MQSIDLIRENLDNSTQRVLAKVEDMRGHCLVPPTPNGGAHTLWTLGHLAYIEHLVVDSFMRGLPNPLAEWEPLFDGADVSNDATQFPEFDAVLQQCRSSRQATVELIAGLQESDLDQVATACPRGLESTFGTWRRCFQYVADHWYMHRGQMADCRRAVGIDRIWV